MSKESDFQKKIIKTINDNYGICLKYNAAYNTKAGIPDLYAAINNKAVFIEVKKSGGKASNIQLAQMNKIKEKSTKYVYLVEPKDFNFLISELNKIKGDL